jgi:small-conductance mechanosensitive channel
MTRNLLFLCFLLGLSPLLFGQLPLPESEKDGEPEVSTPLQDLEAERARVESHIEEATKQLTEAKHALGTPDAQRSDEDEQALQERINLLQARIQVGRRHLKIVEDAKAIRNEKRQLQEEFNNWTGFADPPPFPLDLVEEIARKRKSRQVAMKTDEMRLASFAHGKTLAMEQLESAEKTFRQTLEALEAARTDEAKQKARRKHALSQLTLNVSGEGVAFVRASEQMLTEKLGLHRLHGEFLRRKLTVALQDVRLTQEEVQAKLDTLGKELAVVSENLSKISTSEARASQQFEEVRERFEGQKQRGDIDPFLNLEMQLRQEQLDAIRATMDDINLHIGYVQLHQSSWRNRFDLHQHEDFAKTRTQLEEIDTLLKVVEEGISSLEFARAESDDFEVESRFAIPELVAPRRSLIEAINERNAQLGPTLRSARQLRDFLELWKREIEVRIGALGAAQQVQGWVDVLAENLRRLWSFEILSVEDTLVVDGEQMIEQRPVTIGKVIQAILILAIGLLVASGLARLISRIILPFSAKKWQSRLLIQKLLRVGMIAVVVILALVTVKIPLTVFAFLGGAIAIGIGFGAQNLINNFISGFILLGERPIRAGDRIEIEGTRGIVEKIGERCTRVRRFDGVEILIPNSQLLERSVTNITLSDQRMRLTIRVGVTYGSPTRQVHELLLEIAKAHELVLINPEPVVVFEDFGDNALMFCVYFWIDLAAQADFRAVVTELRHTITERFADRGYEIAFPQRDVHLDAKSAIPVKVLVQSDTTGENRISEASKI